MDNSVAVGWMEGPRGGRFSCCFFQTNMSRFVAGGDRTWLPPNIRDWNQQLGPGCFHLPANSQLQYLL